MRRPSLPKVGLWLLRRLGRGYHIESLIGDLIEQCSQDRGRAWAWREIVMAIFLAQARRWRVSIAPRIAKILWWGLTEMAVMLSIISIADQSRSSHSFEMVNPPFVVTLAVLASIACIGLRYLIRLYRRGEHAAVPHLMAIFVLMTFGVGTLTWAATVHHAHGESAPREDSTIMPPTEIHLASQ